MITLREYQGAAVQRAIGARKSGLNRISICLPVGSGKTAVMTELCRIAKRPIVISPSLNLMWQLHATMEKWLSERVGVEQGLHRLNCIRGLKERVAVCSYASMMSGRDAHRYEQPSFDDTTLVIVDECHINVTPAFKRMMGHFERMGATTIGLSATPYRGRGKPLPYWSRPVYSYSLLQAIRDGYLVRPRAVICESRAIDLSIIEEVAHEWRDDQLNAVLEAERAVQEISSLVLQTFKGQPSAVYCNSVAQAKLLAEVFSRYGAQASIVYSDQNEEERKANMEAFTSGATKIICNVGILAYGWDFPQLINIYNAAPTQSLAVYEQRIGRGTRLLPGTIASGMDAEQRVKAIAASAKPHFNIYDITDASRSLQLVNALDLLDSLARENSERRARGMKALEAGGDVLEQIEAQDEIDRAVRADDPDMKKKRAKLIVGVSFGQEERDLFSAPELPRERQRGWRMLWGPHRGKLIRDLPSDYLAALARRPAPKGAGKGRQIHAAITSEHERRAK